MARVIPAEIRAVMTRHTEELRNSGIQDRVLKMGEAAPPFELADTEGRLVRSTDLLARGPLVISFYRGRW
ncbi:MAG TPA: hypothetical protein VLE48_08730 [Terriglobales bacterium]|nr:hypothetical protein [Terriglobales bacterium]